jgi:hypothetical protein
VLVGTPGGRRWLLPLLLAAVVFSAPGVAQQSVSSAGSGCARALAA